MKLNHHHRYSAWLALLAMVMIFLAPLITQSLAVAQVPASHDTFVAEHAHGDHAPAPAEHSEHHLNQCGYCTLLTQLPALDGCNGPVLGAVLLGSQPGHRGSCHHRVVKTGFPDALPRAPPTLSDTHESPPGA